MINTNILSISLTLAIFIILIVASFYSEKGNINYINNLSNSYNSNNTMKIVSTLSLINLFIFIINPVNNIIHILNWIPAPLHNNISIFLDLNFLFFSSTALIVTWSIMEFSSYYMSGDPYNKNFFRLLIIFLLNMLILTSANNLFFFFIGWESVGFLSFLLISWWSTRQNANNSALQAIIYNRIGDIGILIIIILIISSTNSWDLTNLFLYYNNENEYMKNCILFLTLLAAIGKSAQFGLHPWLPAAMEGPTPVSALLHSSTMVVAGVFLLIRVNSIIVPTQLFLTITTIIGATTAIFAATTAIFQHDIKKIIAYSTTSQLGLMVMTIGLGYPLLALFHICTHAFFKAMLFLCSGSIIHSYNNEQDLRKINNISSNLPITASCLFLGSIALMGIPFLSGFYSKDLILENLTTNPTNLITAFLVFSATSLTAVYSFRIITYCFLINNKNSAINPINEENVNLLNPLLRLAVGSIIIGWLLISFSINNPFLNPHPIIKALPLLVTLSGIAYASIVTTLNANNYNIFGSFLTEAWFFSNVLHSNIINNTSEVSLEFSSRSLDRGWSEISGGESISNVSWNFSQLQQITQSGFIKQYLLSIVIISLTFILCLNYI